MVRDDEEEGRDVMTVCVNDRTVGCCVGWGNGCYIYHPRVEEISKVAEDDYDDFGRCDGGMIRLYQW